MVLDVIAEHAKQNPHAPALIEFTTDGQREELSWAQLIARVEATATALLAAGVAEGEAVAYQLPNQLQFVIYTLAILRIGAVCEPLMPIFREREVSFMVKRSNARVLIVPASFRGYDHRQLALHLLAEPGSGLEHVIIIEEDGGGYRVTMGPDGPIGSPADPPIDGATADGSQLTTRTPSLEHRAQLLFTSGTSGEPKGVLNSHRTLNTAARAHIAHFGLTADDVIYAPSPLAHQTGYLYGMWLAFTLGAPLVFHRSWDAELGFKAVQEAGVTFIQAATPFLADLVRVASERDETPAALRLFVATGAVIPRELAREARDVLGAQVGGGWGSTESCMGAAFAPGDPPEKAWSSDGRAMDHVTIRIVDDLGNPLPAGSEGNFELSSPTMFSGYLERPDLTAEAMTADGYYRTGDLATLDQDGYLNITGRIKDVVNRGGEKVPVAEVEQILYTHPAIRDVAIVAMPDARLGERACAFVVPIGELTFLDMQEYLDAQKVSKSYWPERLELVDDLPRTPSGKVQKYVLREQVAEIAAQGKAVMR